MRNKRSILFSAGVILLVAGMFGSRASAQSIIPFGSQVSSTSVYDARMLNQYTPEELDEIKSKDSELYAALEYYFTKSYSIEIIDCFECIPPDLATFDVTPYENLRQRFDTRVFNNVKLGFKLTLIPISQLEYKLPIHLAKLEYKFGK